MLWPGLVRCYLHLARLPRKLRRQLERQWRCRLAALALLLALGQAPALAASIDVDGTTCTLIEAIDNANDTTTGSVHTDCTTGDPAGADTLNLVAGSTHTLTVVNNSTPQATGLPVVSSVITIEGHGSTITRDGSAPEFRIFAVSSTGDLTLNETTVSGGVTDHRGGGVRNDGAVTLTNTTVSGNNAASAGGGVYNRYGTLTLTNSAVSGNSAAFGGGLYNRLGTFTLTNSTVSGNSADFDGGGVHSFVGSLTLTNTTVSGNSATNGGGVISFGGSLTVTNTTVSGNSASFRGGGVFNSSTLTLTNSTVSGNSAGIGGGVFSFDGSLTLTNTTVSGNSASFYGGGVSSYYTLTLTSSTVSGNTAPRGPELDIPSGTVTADNFNLFGHSGLTNAQAFSGFTPGASDITATSDCTPGPGCMPTALANILAPLANNGGPTQTHALVAGSPAIDMAGPDCPPPDDDQRGVARPQEGPATSGPLRS